MVNRQDMIAAITRGDTLSFNGRIYRGVPQRGAAKSVTSFQSPTGTAVATEFSTVYQLPSDFPTQADVDAFNGQLTQQVSIESERFVLYKANVTHDVTIPPPVGPGWDASDVYRFRIVQDSIGGHAVAFADVYNLTSGQLATIAGAGQAANAVINVEFRRRGATFDYDAAFVAIS